MTNKKGYTINDTAQEIIKECDDWYANHKLEFHERKTIQGERYELTRLGFAKRSCADDANLCEVIEINAGKKRKENEAINKILQNNKFDTQYRRQLEKTSADGTVACYLRLENADIMSDNTIQGGIIRLNYVDASEYIPLTVINDEVIEAAFSSSGLRKGEKETVLVIFELDKEGPHKGNYIAETHIFDKKGVIKDEMSHTLILGNVKPFAVMRTAEVNNIDEMEGYGLPKILNAIPFLKILDLSFNVLYSDLDKAEKILLVNEMLCEMDREGKPKLTPEQKKLFVLLGEKLPDQKSVIQEYNPTIRVQDIVDTMKFCLSMLSMMFGFGTKKYNFENGQITTATEYLGERQDEMHELNRQRKEAIDYITGIVKAIKWFSNTYHKTHYNVDEEILIDFDDSYIVDRETELERKRNDATTFDIPILKVWYLMEAYSLSEDEAKALVEEGQQDNIEPEDEEE